MIEDVDTPVKAAPSQTQETARPMPATGVDAVLQSFWEATPDLVIVTDTDFAPEGPRILYVNPAVENALGLDANDLTGRRYSYLQGLDFCATFPPESAAYLTTGKGINCSTTLTNNLFEELLLGSQILPLRAEGGAVTHLVITHRLLPRIDSSPLTHAEIRGETGCVFRVDEPAAAVPVSVVVDHERLQDYEFYLRQSEEFSRNILDSLPSLIAIIDQNGTVLQVNRTWIDIGLKHKDQARHIVRGVNYLDYLDGANGTYKDIAQAFARGVRAVLTGETDYYAQESPTFTAGEMIWYASRVTRLKRQDQIGAVISHQDISDRKKAEIAKDEALRSAEALSKVAKTLASQLDTEEILRSIIKQVAEVINFEASNLMILENGVGTIRYWEGYPEEVSNIFPSITFPLDEYKNLKKMYLTAEPVICEDTWNCENWENVDGLGWCRSYIGVPIVARGRVHGFLNLDSKTPNYYREKDISRLNSFGHLVAVALENAQLYQSLDRYASDLEVLINERTSELRLLNERLEMVLESTSHGIALVNDQFEIRLANSAFDRIFDRRPGETIGQRFVDQFNLKNRHAVAQSLAHVQKTKMPIRFDIRFERPDGGHLELEVNLVSVDKTDGSVVATLHDISHLRELDRMKDKFIDTISHEFRTPITSIILIAEALCKYEDRLTVVQRNEKITQLSEQANLLREMSEAILEFSRLESGSKGEHFTKVDFANLAQEMMEGVRPKIQDRKQAIAFFHDPQDVIIVDQINLDLARIWRNLLENAVKYSPQNDGEISVRVGIFTHTGGRLTVSKSLHQTAFPDIDELPHGRFAVGQVTDNGHGISGGDQQQLFGRFFRGWAEQSGIPGTGLGLAMVKEMLNRANGDVHVDSELGKGSTFTFWVPLI